MAGGEQRPERAEVDGHPVRGDSDGYQADSRDGYEADSDGYQADGDGDQTDSDGYQADSDGYQADSDGYQVDSDGYQADGDGDHPDGEAPETGAMESSPSTDGDPFRERMAKMKDGWWTQAGYDSFLEVFDESEARWERFGFGPKRKRPAASELPPTAPPEIDLEAVERDATQRQARRGRQVNVRLTEIGYAALSEAARGYGLRPSTLARLLLHRGAIAILEARNLERKDEEE